MLLNIVIGMLVFGIVLSVALVVKLAFKPYRIETKNGKRRGDGCFKGIVA